MNSSAIPGKVCTFGILLKQLRKARGLSQEGLAKQAGLDKSTISRLESGARSPSREKTLMALAQGLSLNQAGLNTLLVSAGRPLRNEKSLLAADPIVSEVERILCSDEIPEHVRSQLRFDIAKSLHWVKDPVKIEFLVA